MRRVETTRQAKRSSLGGRASGDALPGFAWHVFPPDLDVTALAYYSGLGSSISSKKRHAVVTPASANLLMVTALRVTLTYRSACSPSRERNLRQDASALPSLSPHLWPSTALGTQEAMGTQK